MARACLGRRRAPWVVLAAAAAAASPAPSSCPQKSDPHGIWGGDVSVGGNYTLTCRTGFFVIEGVGDSVRRSEGATISCPQTGLWTEDPHCANIDDCAELKWGCGQKGYCIDNQGGGYSCDCEAGVAPVMADDGSGELVCGVLHDTRMCGGVTCGAHGVCVDLQLEAKEFDTGSTNYKCACGDGFHDNGTTCVPKNCGLQSDPLGTWQGQPTYGGHYTLTCGPGSLVDNGWLQKITMSCGSSGLWPKTMPRCQNAWQEARDAQVESMRWWVAVICATLCVVGAALAAGLTMGLVSLQDFEMKLLMETRVEDCETEEQRLQLAQDQKAAERVLPLIQDHHLLLVTLLLLNSMANEALPIFLDQVVPSYLAVLLSVSCVLFFGEILPSAIFTGPSQLRIAAMFSPVVRTLECTFYLVAKPIALALDRCVGHGEHGPRYHRAELQAMLKLHTKHAAPANAEGTDESSDSEEATGTDSALAIPLQIFAEEDDDDGSADGGHGHGGLHHLECMLGQRCLKLGSVRIGDLQLQPRPAAAGACASLSFNQDTPVAEALDDLLKAAPGTCALVNGGLVSAETLLGTALLAHPRG